MIRIVSFSAKALIGCLAIILSSTSCNDEVGDVTFDDTLELSFEVINSELGDNERIVRRASFFRALDNSPLGKYWYDIKQVSVGRVRYVIEDYSGLSSIAITDCKLGFGRPSEVNPSLYIQLGVTDLKTIDRVERTLQTTQSELDDLTKMIKFERKINGEIEAVFAKKPVRFIMQVYIDAKFVAKGRKGVTPN